MPDREPLARVGSEGGSMEGHVTLRCGKFPVDYGERRKLEGVAVQINAAASAWMDREVKKALNEAFPDGGMKNYCKEHGVFWIDTGLGICPVDREAKKGMDAYTERDTLALAKIQGEDIQDAVDAERERCAKIVDHLAWKILIGSSDAFSQTVIDECIRIFRHHVEFTAASIRSTPGQVFSKSWAEQALKDEEGHDISAGPEIYPLGKPGQEPK